KKGNVQGFYHWPGTGQMFSSARDMARFLEAQLGEVSQPAGLPEAVALAHRPLADNPPYHEQAQAWEGRKFTVTLGDKNGALNNTSSYIGIVPEKHIGMVLLTNRGEQYAAKVGRRTLLRLALPENIAMRELKALDDKDENDE